MKNSIAKLICSMLVLTASAAHADFKSDLVARFPSIAGSKIEPAFDGFWSVVKGGEVVYVRDDLSIMFNGDVIDLQNNKSLTNQLREANKPKINIADFDPSDAIIFGNGSRKLYIFSDPDCPFCRQLESELDKLQDVKVYIFPLPLTSLHPNARVIAEAIWCQRDRAGAWKGYLKGGVTPPVATCENPVSRNLALAAKLNIQGTPALIFEDGSFIPGMIPAQRIEYQIAGVKP